MCTRRCILPTYATQENDEALLASKREAALQSRHQSLEDGAHSLSQLKDQLRDARNQVCLCFSCVVLISAPFPDGIIVVAICAVSHNIH